jgi:hypothetical protein
MSCYNFKIHSAVLTSLQCTYNPDLSFAVQNLHILINCMVLLIFVYFINKQ